MTENNTERLESLIDQAATDSIERLLASFSGPEIARAISQLPREKQTHLLEALQPANAADVVERLSDVQAAQIVGRLEADTAAAIVHELPSDEQADLVGDLPHDRSEAILAELESDEATQLKQLVEYPDDVAGGLMIALAVFLPIISDMSGCSGNQAIAVSMRELSLGLARPSDLLRVWLKEITVGLIIGISLGLLVAFVAYAWKGNIYLGLVVGVALSINTLISVSIGGTLPLLMKRHGPSPRVWPGSYDRHGHVRFLLRASKKITSAIDK